jgi:hypothetical protein
MKPNPEQIEKIMSAVPEGARVIAVTVPTRALRVIALAGEKTFRVEQLEPITWIWQPRSTHSGDTPWESFGPALQDAMDKQEALKLEITRAMIAQKQAMRLAEAQALNPEKLDGEPRI